MTDKTKRYHSVSVILHWVMALSFLAMLGSGLAMTRQGLLDQSLQYQVYQWHKSLGVLLLFAFFLRLSWRFFHKPPSLPSSFKGLEKLAAKAGHYAFYFWMIALPLSGWVMVSASVYGLPTMVFNWFEWPHIPGIQGDEAMENYAKLAHEILAYSFIALIVTHIAAVIKHAVVEKHNLLPRMWFGKAALLFLLTLTPVKAQAETYTVLKDDSALRFSGTHAGKDFSGVFEQWDADITFDHDALDESKVVVTIQTGTAITGIKTYDKTLPQRDWFDVKNHPEAVFTSESFAALEEEGLFQVNGVLTIKEISKPLELLFKLTPEKNGSLRSVSYFEVKRLDFDIGKKSDPKAEWVSETLKMQFEVVAQPPS